MQNIDLKNVNWKEPQNAFLLLAILFMLASSYGFYEFLYSAKKDSLTQLQTEVQASKDTLNVINAKVSKKAELETQLKTSEMELERLRNMFPSNEMVVGRLKDLHSVMVASGVAINKFQPSNLSQVKKDSLNPNDPRSYYNENFYDVEMVGGYHEMGQMFAEIANFKYPTTIFNLKTTPVADLDDQVKKMEEQGWVPKTVRVSFQLSTFTSRK